MSDLEGAQVTEALLGKTITWVHYDQSDDAGGMGSDHLFLTFSDGSKVEFSAVGGQGGSGSLYVESGTRVRDIYKVKEPSPEDAPFSAAAFMHRFREGT